MRAQTLLPGLIFCHGIAAQHLPLPALPYEYNALEPYIDEMTMRTHHLKHHQVYTDKANAVLSKLRQDPKTKHLAKMGIDKLLTQLEAVDDEADRAILRNHGGGYVNHDLFWRIMSPKGGPQTLKENGHLATAIVSTFGSLDGFFKEFSDKAVAIFGSGWTWLYVDANGSLKITTTSNQDTPAMSPGNYPILCLDVWEHAYYLQYKNDRVDYIKNWWHIVNWPEVEERYQRAKVAGTEKSEL